ncbi:MAG: iron transporter [Clostridia bacterium]|nr:iron transporter [Clostridia bacterium]
MKTKAISILCVCVMLLALCAGCSQKGAETAEPALSDGVYSAVFETDSSMFHVNEALDGRGTLTVENGEMTIHVTLASTRIVNLYPGTAEEAQAEGAVLLMPSVDEVTYSDGMTEEAYGFDLPVPALDTEFDCAILGESGRWFDHKVKVYDPIPADAETGTETAGLPDGEYTIDVTLSGGSGKASVESPARITSKNGTAEVLIVMSSPHYEYMTVGDVQYDPVNEDGNSAFLIPFNPDIDGNMEVSALTTAMSEPHLIDYTLNFNMISIKGE